MSHSSERVEAPGAGARARFFAWAGYAAAIWAFVFAATSFYWALGGRVGVETIGDAITKPALAGDPTILAIVWITGALKVVAGAVALALVQPWGRRLARWGAAARWVGSERAFPGLRRGESGPGWLDRPGRDPGSGGPGRGRRALASFPVGSVVAAWRCPLRPGGVVIPSPTYYVRLTYLIAAAIMRRSSRSSASTASGALPLPHGSRARRALKKQINSARRG